MDIASGRPSERKGTKVDVRFYDNTTDEGSIIIVYLSPNVERGMDRE